MQSNITMGVSDEKVFPSSAAEFPRRTSNYTISLIIHNEVFDVSLQVDIFPSFFHLIMLEMGRKKRSGSESKVERRIHPSILCFAFASIFCIYFAKLV